MIVLLTVFAIIVLVVFLCLLALTLLVRVRLPRALEPPPMPGPWPRVSVIVPAMNEAETIEPAMRSLLALDYPALEIIAVDDRSTDATGAILDRLAAAMPDRLRVLHLETLPPGWLGKCNALEQAAERATGEWILFTDADVLFTPDALRTAVALAEAGTRERSEAGVPGGGTSRDTVARVDHVVMFPRMLWHGYAEAALLSLFGMALSIGFRLWAVNGTSKRAFFGVGAFNMIRRPMYERIGRHTALRLEVADDLKLGFLVKKHGGRTLAVHAGEQVRVRWREGARDTMRGVERSGFAGLDFSMARTLGAVVGCIGGLLAPWYLPLAAGGDVVVTVLSVVSFVVAMAAYAVNAGLHGLPRWIGLLHPLACVLFAYAMARSAIVTTARGGLSWRDTFYSIAELKRGTVR